VTEARAQLGAAEFAFGLQSNGVLLDKDWQAFSEQTGVSLSLSQDGSAYRANRWRFQSRRQYRRIYKRLKKVNIAGILAVLTKNNIRSIIPFMWRSLLRQRNRGFLVNAGEFVKNSPLDPEELTGAQLVRGFYLPLLRWLSFFPWLHEQNTMRFLRDFILNYLYDRQAYSRDNVLDICNMKFCSAGNGIINLLPNGDLWACQCSSGQSAYHLGNIYTLKTDLFELKYFRKLWESAWQVATSVRRAGCDVCAAADICQYGCKAFAQLKTEGLSAIRRELTCVLAKMLKKYFLKNSRDMIFLFALTREMPLRKKGKLAQIQLPVEEETAAGRYTLRAQEKQDLKIITVNGRAYVSFPVNALNFSNRLALCWRNIFKKSKFSRDLDYFDYIEKHYLDLVQQYCNMSEKIYGFPEVLSPDIARTIFLGRPSAEAERSLGKIFFNKLCRHSLLTNAERKNNVALLVTGGCGSGKTSLLSKLDIPRDCALITDIPLCEMRGEINIDELLEKKYIVQILFIYRDPLESFKVVLRRPEVLSEESDFLVENYIDIYMRTIEVAIQLKKKYKEQIAIWFINNTAADLSQITFQPFDELTAKTYAAKYTWESLRQLLQKELRQAMARKV
jgi:radical SAM protein with 4Fe4S-binding SPASM domain